MYSVHVFHSLLCLQSLNLIQGYCWTTFCSRLLGERLGNHCIRAHSVHFACCHALFVYETICFCMHISWRFVCSFFLFSAMYLSTVLAYADVDTFDFCDLIIWSPICSNFCRFMFLCCGL